MALTKTQYYGTGRRKRSVARVYLRPGKGIIRINNKPLDEYFGDNAQRFLVRQALEATETTGQFDMVVNVMGGGVNGQAGAIRHGVSRALLQVPAVQYRDVLKKAGFLTRDAREVERKKYGQPKARRRFQFSKR
ncbi:MAG: 30S ribosomal protein S9 [Deltaproteobacteria bacterium]|nr:30S ribosomal protein S9 [Deltaproteobacteria bacterium]